MFKLAGSKPEERAEVFREKSQEVKRKTWLKGFCREKRAPAGEGVNSL